MENSHLVAIMRTFSDKEARDLRKWLNSPFHNQREDVVQLFEYLMAGAHLQEEKFLRKERVFSKIFPDEPFDDAKLRQSMHFLLKAAEEFLIYQELRGDDVRSRMALSSVYRQRKLDKAFKKTIRSVETLQEKNPYRDEHYLRNEYLLELEKYTFLDGKKRTVQMNLQEMADALDVTFLADKLRQSCLMFAHQAVYKVKYQIGLLDEVLMFVEREGLLKHPAIAIYYFGLMAFKDETNRDYFQNLRQEIQKNKAFFSPTEIRDIYLMTINYCIRRANTGDEEIFIGEAFNLYEQGLNDRILIENGVVSPFTFRNAVSAGLKLKKYDWVYTFIHEFKLLLPEKYRESFFLHSLARLNYEKREYDSAMRLLVQTDFDDVLINLNAKTMLMKIYHELDELDALESLLGSMRTYINRKDLMGSYKTNYQNIIKLTKKLVRINPYDGQQKEKLKKSIESTNPLTERQWLLEQLESL